MLISFDAVLDFAQTIAVIALLALAYGTLHRRMAHKWQTCLVLGVLFGLCAALAMHNTLSPMPGVLVDLRAVPIALAAAYLEPGGAIVALLVAVFSRMAIGGVGTVSGVAGLFTTFAVCLATGRLAGLPGTRSLPRLGLLGLGCSSGLGSLLLLPWDVALRFLGQVGPTVALCNLLGFVAVASIIERERKLLSREAGLVHASVTDPLTRLLNRRGFEEAYARQTADRRRQRGSALMILDVDHFKAVNDTYGHAFGDRVLHEVAHRLVRAGRQGDLVARVGGEEMAVHMANLTKAEAVATADRLRGEVSAHAFVTPGGAPVHVTASIGLCWTETPAELMPAMARADAALYAAKRGGRDRFVLAA